MKIIKVKLSDLKISVDGIYAHLGYKSTQADWYDKEIIDKIISDLSDICEPQIGYVIRTFTKIKKNTLSIAQTDFHVGSRIGDNLKDSNSIAIFVITAGAEFDNYLSSYNKSGDIFYTYIINAIGSEIAESTVRYLRNHLDKKIKKNGLYCTQVYSPGHCDWDLHEQKLLFSLLPNTPCGVRLNESSLMIPTKSVSGIIGFSCSQIDSKCECEICTLYNCYKRKII